MTNIDHILICSNKTFREKGKIPIPLLKTESREPNEIIGIAKSPDEKFLALITGKNLIMEE